MFFHESAATGVACAPTPGNLALFYGSIEHRIGIPLRNFSGSRLTLVVKFE